MYPQLRPSNGGTESAEARTCSLHGCEIMELQGTPFCTKPIPKEGPSKAQLRPIWTLLSDGGGIEGGTLEVHDDMSPQHRLSGTSSVFEACKASDHEVLSLLFVQFVRLPEASKVLDWRLPSYLERS